MSVPTLQEIYKKRGYTRAEIAKLMGVSEDLVYRWERGTRGVSSDKLIELTAILECSSDQILGIEPFHNSNSSANIRTCAKGLSTIEEGRSA